MAAEFGRCLVGFQYHGKRVPANGGSQAVLNERPSTQKYPWASNLRQKLKEDGMLDVKADHLLFTQDVEFSSPSAAAGVIHGGQANGLTAWKNKNGETLKDLESK